MSGYQTGKSGVQFTADEAARRDSQPLVVSCLFCGWRYTGTALQGRTEALAHRLEAHPEAAVRKPRRARRIKRGYLRSTDENEQIAVDAAEANRVRAEREDAERLEKVLRALARDAA